MTFDKNQNAGKGTDVNKSADIGKDKEKEKDLNRQSQNKPGQDKGGLGQDRGHQVGGKGDAAQKGKIGE